MYSVCSLFREASQASCTYSGEPSTVLDPSGKRLLPNLVAVTYFSRLPLMAFPVQEHGALCRSMKLQLSEAAEHEEFRDAVYRSRSRSCTYKKLVREGPVNIGSIKKCCAKLQGFVYDGDALVVSHRTCGVFVRCGHTHTSESLH